MLTSEVTLGEEGSLNLNICACKMRAFCLPLSNLPDLCTDHLRTRNNQEALFQVIR
jgi:hypothetical protein